MIQENKKLNIRPSLLGCSRDQIQEAMHPFKQPPYRGNQIYSWIHHHNIDSFDEMNNIPKEFRRKLSANFTIKNLQLADMKIASDGTEKYLWKLSDNRHVESVLIPEKRRNTICISSQVGCSLQCRCRGPDCFGHRSYTAQRRHRPRPPHLPKTEAARVAEASAENAVRFFLAG